MKLTNGTLHHAIISNFVETGSAPTVAELSATFGVGDTAIVSALRELEEYHGVVLHPHSSEVWVCHPFSSAPTNFWVESGNHAWWGNCAWCSMGVAALVAQDTRITTTLGAESRQVTCSIVDGVLSHPQLLVHFPIPMKRAWDNVIYTCSNMLMFDTESAVDDWCKRHNMPKGDIRSLEQVWQFARVWYGRHLDKDWMKWSAAEAKSIFARFGLTGPTWDIPDAGERF